MKKFMKYWRSIALSMLFHSLCLVLLGQDQKDRYFKSFDLMKFVLSSETDEEHCLGLIDNNQYCYIQSYNSNNDTYEIIYNHYSGSYQFVFTLLGKDSIHVSLISLYSPSYKEEMVLYRKGDKIINELSWIDNMGNKHKYREDIYDKNLFLESKYILKSAVDEVDIRLTTRYKTGFYVFENDDEYKQISFDDMSYNTFIVETRVDYYYHILEMDYMLKKEEVTYNYEIDRNNINQLFIDTLGQTVFFTPYMRNIEVNGDAMLWIHLVSAGIIPPY